MTLFVRPAPTAHSVAIPTTFADPASRVSPVVRAALFLFVLSIFFEMPNRTFPLEVDSTTGLLFLGTTLLHPVACYRRVPGALLGFAAYLWILAISVAVNYAQHGSHNVAMASQDMIEICLLLVVLCALFNVLLQDDRVLRDVLLALALGGTLRAALQILGVGASEYTVWTGGERVSMFGQNDNLSAMIMAAALAIIVGLRMIRTRGLPVFGPLSWPMAAAIGVAIIQTGSRGGLLCAGVGLSVYWFRGPTLLIRLRNGLLGIVAAAALAWGAMHTEVMRNRIEQSATEGNMAGRERIYPAAIQMFLEKPVLGWGTADNMFEVARRIGDRKHEWRDVHDLLLETLTTTGILGTVPFFIGLGLCIRSAWRARHGPLGALPLGVLGAVLTGCISGTWVQSKILWITLAFSLAAGARWARPSDAIAGGA